MDSFVDEVVVPTPFQILEPPLKDWRLKFQAGTLQKKDFMEFFQRESRKYFEYHNEDNGLDSTRNSLKCMFKEAGAKEGIIDILLEFILGDNPNIVLDKLRAEGATQSVCGKVFKMGEPTYSCRECGMDSTCVLCVSCFKQSAHRYHKYKMCTSAGGGCCDCGDEEAWKKDPYCEQHLRGKENNMNSTIITDVMKERCEIALIAVLSFCVNYLEIESKASLECLDGDGAGDDHFCTVLYNDESHTFDQVIQTLTKIAKCPSKDAAEIVASIDREGRAVVKCDRFNECNQLKEAIEKQSIPPNLPTPPTSRANQSLRVSVLHVRAVACQQFSLQLLNWCQEFLVRHSTFRQIFARIIMDKKAPYCIRHILEYDVKLWKSARTCWHRLLISGMLMEYDNKMALAQEFSKNYATIVQDFISDDHDHSFSIISLSVQLFTVPSISHYLIAKEGIFHKLLHTFYHRSIEQFIQNKTLHFSKHLSTAIHFKRASYILYDLRYLLSFKPDVWTDELREGFIEGCKALLRVLSAMQGMESIVRQTGQHMDYEPEWESAFNLHIKLANAITLVLDWCSTDHKVLVKLYQMVMRHLCMNTFIVGDITTEEKSVAGHIAKCLVYDVSSSPVSIHLPLSRFFAGVYLHLGRYNLNFDSAAQVKRSPEELMEPILCTQTMIAQVHANMWRRNGYSLLHQLYFYRNVRCRTEMLDRDIVGMQIGASLIESNQYLIYILNKFGLIDWIQPNYEEDKATSTTDDDFFRQLSMIDEFLELLIVIIGERYTPGVAHVTDEDRTKKEIIQLLCIKSYSHSELNRALPDSNNETVLEDVIDSVAVFKRPQLHETKGVYQLKDELFDEYNMYFYHYTKEEKSKSEEKQRARRKANGELVCCPPPKLPKLTDSFITIANLLQCDVMMYLFNIILERALDLKSKGFQENHLQKILHLIGYGLQEEESGHYPFLSFFERSQKYRLLQKLEELAHSGRVEAHRDFILWIIKKFKEIQAKYNAAESHVMESSDAKESNENVDDDSEISVAPLTTAEQEKREKEERARLAAERRAKLLAQMQNAQMNFMKTNAEMFANANDVASVTSKDALAKRGSNANMEWQGDVSLEEGAVAYKTVACLGVERRLQQPEEQQFTCILCFEEAKVSKAGPVLVYLAFVQNSKVIKSETPYATSVHTSSCGHVMHVECWQEYYSNEESKELRRPRRHPLLISSIPPHTEFQCPYCRCMSNSIIPLTVPLSNYSPPNVIHEGDEVFPIDLWVESMRVFSEKFENLVTNVEQDLWHDKLPEWLPTLKEAHILTEPALFELMAQPMKPLDVPTNWSYYVEHYIKTLHKSTDLLLYMWHSCAYTIQSLEVLLRATGKTFKDEMSIRHKSCLSALIRACSLHAATLSETDIKSLIIPVHNLLGVVFKQRGECILEWDCFNKMIFTLMMVPNVVFSRGRNSGSIVVNGSLMDFYTLQIFFLANMVKAIILYEQSSEDDDGLMEIDEEQQQHEIEEKEHPQQEQLDMSQKSLYNIWSFFNRYNLQYRQKQQRQQQQQQSQNLSKLNEENMDSGMLGVQQEQQEHFNNEINDDANCLEMEINNTTCSPELVNALLQHIKREMREFLRCCCLFFHFITDVEFPECLKDDDSFENMCKYLGLNSNLEEYFDTEKPYATILEMFASHSDITNFVTAASKSDILPCVRQIPQLITLPDDYSDLINSISEFSCPNNEHEEMKTPTMCLNCGEMLCGQSYCCQPELDERPVGACTYHTRLCAGEVGIFLRIRDCQIVFLGKNKGCFVQPPYLDQYGETDMGLRRGNPLRLCPARYSKIHIKWLSHGLHEEISRANEHASTSGTQWHHM